MFALQGPQNDATDAIGLIDVDGQAMLLPIQLKELPPSHRNAHIELQDILTKLGKARSGARGTIVAIHINRDVHIEMSKLTIPTGIAELWFYGATDETQDTWTLIGDNLTSPGLSSIFKHPVRRLLVRTGWMQTPISGPYA